MIRRGTPEDADEFVDLALYAYGFPETQRERIKSVFAGVFREFECVEVDGHPVAIARMIPFEQNVRGSWKKMGGLAMVASAPEHRGEGNVRRLVTKMLEDLRIDGYAVSCLYPFKDTFYMALGYVKMPQWGQLELDPKDLAMTRCPSGYTLERISTSAAAADIWKKIHAEVVQQYHGSVRRSDARWNELIARSQQKVVIVRGPRGDPEGIMLYSIKGYGHEFTWVEEGTISVSEMLWTTLAARDALLSFIFSHRDQICQVRIPLTPLTTDYYYWVHNTHSPTVKMRMVHMARIVNVEEALNGMAVNIDGEVTIRISDAQLPGNTGTYLLKARAGTLTVERSNSSAEVDMTIEGITALMYGTLSLRQIVALGWLSGDAPPILSDWFTPAIPWLTEDF
ncbi:MAG: GNAT family N-acetyltransferase [Candidatus Thorarchaeota archaeon]